MANELASAEARQAAERIRELVIQYLRGMCFVLEGDVKQRANTAAMNEALNIAISELSLPDDPNAQGTRGFLVPLTDALADSYAAVVRERDEARNCTVCSYCGEIQRHVDSWEKKVDVILAHIETCPKSPLKQLLDAKQALEAAERLNGELVEALRKAVASMEVATNCKFGVLPELRAAIKSATPKQGEVGK